VNELFQSAAAFRERALGVMLTGMGDDGALGAKAMFGVGATILTQSGETCAVYGMPRAVVEGKASTASLAPEDMARAIAGLGTPSFSRIANAA
jgi:two-component system chemotaxis response regulator CheB